MIGIQVVAVRNEGMRLLIIIVFQDFILHSDGGGSLRCTKCGYGSLRMNNRMFRCKNSGLHRISFHFSSFHPCEMKWTVAPHFTPRNSNVPDSLYPSLTQVGVSSRKHKNTTLFHSSLLVSKLNNNILNFIRF